MLRGCIQVLWYMATQLRKDSSDYRTAVVPKQDSNAPDNIHEMIRSLNRMAELFPVSNIALVLYWAYEHNPCAICRASTLFQLTKTGIPLANDLLHECQFDADSDIKVWAAEQINSRVIANQHHATILQA